MITQPTPEQIKAARTAAGDSQAQAAERIYAPSYRTWQNWEKDGAGSRAMPLAAWELYLIKTEQTNKIILK